MNLFHEQLKLENEVSVQTVNFCRSSKLESMEHLIQKWKWKESIVKNLKQKVKVGELPCIFFVVNIKKYKKIF